MIGIIDYRAGNLFSVERAVAYLGFKTRFIRTPAQLRGVDKIILPGVGAFATAVKQLKKQALFRAIKEWLIQGRPYLGICLGMQLLYTGSEESTTEQGFGIFPETVKCFPQLKVPQIGWNQAKFLRATPLIKDLEQEAYFYFLHSYYVGLSDKDYVLAKTVYGIEYTSAVNWGNIFGLQFHPEKSGPAGLSLLKNWLALC